MITKVYLEPDWQQYDRHIVQYIARTIFPNAAVELNDEPSYCAVKTDEHEGEDL